MAVLIMNKTNLLTQQFNNVTRIEFDGSNYVIYDHTTHSYPKKSWLITILF